MRGRLTGVVAVIGLTFGLVGGCVFNTPAIGRSASFSAVATISTTDVWAVGSYNDGLGHSRGLIEHFDGHAWSVAGTPGGASAFGGINAISASDIYATSFEGTWHWNGRRWGAVTDLNGYTLSAIAHSPAGAVMAIGFHGRGAPDVVLTHTASGWVPLSTPSPPLSSLHRTCDVTVRIESIALDSPGDVWVSGATSNDNVAGANCAYVAHWDGSHWTAPPVPNGTGNQGSGIGSLSVRGPHDVWAVGSSTTITGPDQRFESENGYVVRWDGTRWQELCNFGCGPDWSSIDATGKGVWVVGETVFPDDPFTQALMEIDRWSGNGWVRQAVQTINPPSEGGVPVNSLVDVSVRNGFVVSVGSFLTNNQMTPLPLVDQRPDN